MRFLFLADMQLGAYASFSGLSEEAVTEYARRGMTVAAVPRATGFEWDSRLYEQAVARANRLRPDLVVIGGDMVDEAGNPEQLAEFLRITRRLDHDIPVRWLPGNHDIAPDNLVPTPDGLARYRETFGPDYYAFDHGPLRFVALDTTVIGHPELVPDEWTVQLAFLQGELEAARRREQPVILLGHHPLFTRRPDEPDDYWNLPLARRRAILDLVHRYRVPLALAGHRHRNAIARDGAFEMVTSGPVGYPLGEDPPGLRLVEVTGEGISHRYLPIGSR